MIFYLESYKQDYRISKVARSIEICDELLADKFDVMYINKDRIIFQPSGLEVSIGANATEKINSLTDYDIIEITSNGYGHRLYSKHEGDTSIITTGKCNSNCIMCPASEHERKSFGETPIQNILKFIEYLPEDLYNLVITGGEPTLIKDNFFVMMKSIKDKFPYTQVLLLTNGRSMSSKQLYEKLLSTAPADLKIAIPLHGNHDELHDSITQVPGSFKQTVAGIHNLLNSGIKIEIRVVVNGQNYTYLKQISEFIANNFRGVFCVNFVGLEVRGNCVVNFSKAYVDYSVASQNISPAVDILVQQGFDVGIYNYPLCLLDSGYWSIAAKSISGYKSKFYDKCDSCRVKNNCCGIFQATMSYVKPEVYPIQ